MARPNILVVDSDEGFGNMLKEGLNNTGYYQAKWSQTAHEALQSLVTAPYDLVIIDMGITDIRPLSLVQAVRKIKKDMRIMMIPEMGKQLPEQIQSLDINGVLTKPFFVGDLPDLVDKAMGRTRTAVAAPSPPPPPESPAPAPAAGPNHTGPEKKPAVETPDIPAQAPVVPPLPQEKIRFLRANETEIMRLLNDLNREVRAEAILLIAGQELIAQAGLLSRDQCHNLAMLVAQSSQAAAQAANFLGEKSGRFAQSLHEGSEYRVYTLTVGQGILLSLALSSNVPLGMIRHQCRLIVEQITRFT